MQAKKLGDVLNFDDNYILWTSDGLDQLLYIDRDDTEYCDPLSDDWAACRLACWHRDYKLGHDVPENEPERFWQRLVRENVSDEEILNAVKSGKLEGIRITPNTDEQGSYDVYEVCYLAGFQTAKEAEEYCEYSEIPEEYVPAYIMDDLTISHCQILLEPYMEWTNLYLYDHSGITMSCSKTDNPFSCRWDSGQVGWAYIRKETAIKELGATDENWRELANKHMEDVIETYDQYLRGEVYGFGVYDRKAGTEDNFEAGDTMWCFYGDDFDKNGLFDEAIACSKGLKEAIESGDYHSGNISCVDDIYDIIEAGRVSA